MGFFSSCESNVIIVWNSRCTPPSPVKLTITKMFEIVGHLGPRDKAPGLLGNVKDRRCQTFKPGHNWFSIGFFIIKKDEKAATLSILHPFVLKRFGQNVGKVFYVCVETNDGINHFESCI